MTYDYSPYAVHEYLALFPEMDDGTFDALVISVYKIGVLDPIVLAPDGRRIVDGRARFRALKAAAPLSRPTFRVLGSHYTEPRIIDVIRSRNLHRRHLDDDRIAALMETYLRLRAETTA